MLKGIIFDFDGVIAESVQVKTDAFAALYASYGADNVSKVVEHHEANGGMSRFEKIRLYHESFLNRTVTKEEITNLASQFSELVVEKVIDAPYVPGALEYIQQSYKQYKLLISTGTPTQEMNKILSGRKIAHYFTDVFGSPPKKIEHLNNIMSIYGMKPNELIFYGDSNADLDAASNANIKFVLNRNQHNEKLVLQFNGNIIDGFTELL